MFWNAPVTLAASDSVAPLLLVRPEVPAVTLDYQMQIGARTACAAHAAQSTTPCTHARAGGRIEIMERKINIVLRHAPLETADSIIVFIFCSFS